MIQCKLYLTNSSGRNLTLAKAVGTVSFSPSPPSIMSNGLKYGPITVNGGQNQMKFWVSYIDENSIQTDPQYEIKLETKDKVNVWFSAPKGQSIAWRQAGGLPDFQLNVTYQ
ncbi:hypothetical protein KFU94_66375 [Chloroflexi bacterium TSY]|nr:hypothetical protein [Chloroflexi bacterium TSY]